MVDAPEDVELPEDPDDESRTTTHLSHTETSLVQQEELAEEREVRRREAQRKIAALARQSVEDRRRQGDVARSHNVPSNVSEVRYDVAGQSYPLRHVNGCKTCASPYRAEIEKLLAYGHTAGWISKQLPEEADLSLHNIYNHSIKHLPIEISRRIAIRELRAEEVGKSLTEGTELLIDEVTLMREVMQETVKGMVEGKLQPTISEGLRAAQLLNAMTSDDGGSIDQQAYTASMMRYFQIAQQTMPDDVFMSFIEGVRRDPILKALADKAKEPPMIEAQALD